nr:putative nuclease HARBI1 [Dermacentor andersoni]XP_054926116.1 putative nuclease HARBI1 [Dermacentor andersoni]
MEQQLMDSHWHHRNTIVCNVFQVCDSDLRVLHVDPRFAGSCHDAHVWRYASLRRRIASGRIAVQDGEYLLGDSAYPLEPWLLTPAPGHPAPHTPEGRYNAAHTSARSAVERCIGVMKSRFRCLQRHRALHYGPKKAATIVAACAALHNLCIDENVPHTGRAYSDGDDDGDRPHASSSSATQGEAPRARRALYLRGRAARARQIAILSIARNRHLQHVQNAVCHARRLQR